MYGILDNFCSRFAPAYARMTVGPEKPLPHLSSLSTKIGPPGCSFYSISGSEFFGIAPTHV